MAFEPVLGLWDFVAEVLDAFAGEGWRVTHVQADKAKLVEVLRPSQYEVVGT